MKTVVRMQEPEVVSATSAHIALIDPDTDLPVAEIAIRGAGYVVLTEQERAEIAEDVRWAMDAHYAGNFQIPDREGGYHGEPRLWEQVAAEQAAKRGSPSRVTRVGGKKIRVPESLEDIQYPDGCEFLPLTDEERAAGQTIGIVSVPSRKLDSSYDGAKRFRRACKRARAQQLAFLAAQKDPSSVEEGEADEESED